MSVQTEHPYVLPQNFVPRTHTKFVPTFNTTKGNMSKKDVPDNRKVGDMIVGNVEAAQRRISTAANMGLVTTNTNFQPTFEQLFSSLVRQQMLSEPFHAEIFRTTLQATQVELKPVIAKLNHLHELLRSMDTKFTYTYNFNPKSRYNTQLASPEGKAFAAKRLEIFRKEFLRRFCPEGLDLTRIDLRTLLGLCNGIHPDSFVDVHGQTIILDGQPNVAPKVTCIAKHCTIQGDGRPVFTGMDDTSLPHLLAILQSFNVDHMIEAALALPLCQYCFHHRHMACSATCHKNALLEHSCECSRDWNFQPPPNHQRNNQQRRGEHRNNQQRDGGKRKERASASSNRKSKQSKYADLPPCRYMDNCATLEAYLKDRNLPQCPFNHSIWHFQAINERLDAPRSSSSSTAETATTKNQSPTKTPANGGKD